MVKSKAEELDDIPVYEPCLQPKGVRYIDDSDVDVNEVRV